MQQTKRVLIIGLDPAVVDYIRWPELSPEKLRAGLEANRADLNARGYSAEICFVDLGSTAETTAKETLSQKSFDCVLIGAGVRQDEFLLFEKLINVVHQYAPTAKIFFNTNPSDTAAGVLRWI